MKPYCVLTLSKYDDHLDRLLSSLLASQPDLKLKEIYVVDDGLSKETKKRWKVNYIPGEKPFNFARNFNLGIQAVPKKRDVFFVGDDAMLLTKQGLDKLAAICHQENKVGMAGPAIMGGVNSPYQPLGVLDKPTKLSELQFDVEKSYQYTLIFHAVYLKRKLVDIVGPIPEELVGYGYEDNYYSLKMILAGYDWIIDPDVIVFHGWNEHEQSASYYQSGMSQQEILEQMEHNSKIFRNIANKIFEDFQKRQGDI